MTLGYDEFAYFADNARDAGLVWEGPPTVTRREVAIEGERSVSGLVWGDGPPELVLVHGGAQNAHTWDTVALALGCPLYAVDMPGHGQSGWRADHAYNPANMAGDLSVAIAEVAPDAVGVVGMSLGGMSSLALAHHHPELVRELVMIDVTPGTDSVKAEPIIAFIDGPEYFADFDEILSRTIEFNPTRSESSLRRGVMHNAHAMDDGRWTWNYDRERGDRAQGEGVADFATMWDHLGGLSQKLTLLRGSLSGVVGDEDVEEFERRRPNDRVIVVEDAGHSIQGDQPLVLAGLLREIFPGLSGTGAPAI